MKYKTFKKTIENQFDLVISDVVDPDDVDYLIKNTCNILDNIIDEATLDYLFYSMLKNNKEGSYLVKMVDGCLTTINIKNTWKSVKEPTLKELLIHELQDYNNLMVSKDNHSIKEAVQNEIRKVITSEVPDLKWNYRWGGKTIFLEFLESKKKPISINFTTEGVEIV